MHVAASGRGRAAVAVACLAAVCAGDLAGAAWHGWFADGPLVIAAAGAAALLLGLRGSLAVAITSGAVAVPLLAAASRLVSPGEHGWADDLTFFALLIAAPLTAGVLWRRRAAQLAEVHALAAEVAAQRSLEVRAARAEEGARIAGTLNDGLARAMSELVRATDPAAEGAATADFAAIERSARAALDQLRRHLDELSPTRDAGVLEPGDAERAQPQPDRTPRPAPHPLTAVDVLAALSGAPLALETTLGAAARGPLWANALAAVAVGAPLLLRRRTPIAAAAAFLVLGAAMSAALAPLPTTVTMMIPLLLAGYGVGAYPRGIRSRLVGLAVLVAGVLLIVAASPAQARDLAGLAPTLLWAALGAAAGWAVADRASRVRRHRALLAERAAGRDAELRLAIAEQRRAAARELHDTGASALTVVCLHAQAARASNDDARRAAALGTIATAVRAGLAELRASLDGDGTVPLDLREVVHAARAGGTPIALEIVGALDALDAPRRDALARVAREALTNCARHAPGAAVVLRVACAPHAATIEVTDAGTAAPGTGSPLGAGRGLAGLAERLAALGGTLEAAAREPAGFRVRATLPRAEGAAP